MKKNLLLTAFCLLSLIACNDPVKPPVVVDNKPPVVVPEFNQDSAYQYVQAQVDFGPRVPQSPAHLACSEWIKTQMESFGWQVQFQEAVIDGFDNNKLPIRNIIASINPQARERILLCAHWDTRRIADQDTTRKNEPILGADDGGSGVGVLMEVARVLGKNPINIGVEIVFFDAEDQGESGEKMMKRQTWCLGSQYWSKNVHAMVETPRFGILLDMVGSTGARFPKEGVSTNRALGVVELVWSEAQNLGYSDLFVNEQFGDLVDDHVFVNDIARIPTIDIINLPTNKGASGTFGHYWHTHKDNMSIINRSSLNAVGNVLLNVLYKEAAEQ